MNREPENAVWRDLTDPRRAEYLDDLEEGLKDPEFDNVQIPEKFGPVKEIIDDHKIKRYAFEMDDYLPWAMCNKENPFGKKRIAHATLITNDIVQLFTLAYKGSQVIGLHTELEMWFKHPAEIDEVVELEGAYTESYVKRGQGYVVLDAKVTGNGGKEIVKYRGVEILKTCPGKVAGRAAAQPEKRVTGEIPDGSVHIDVITPDTRKGDVVGPLKKTITAEQAAVFSRTGEFVVNIHNNLERAREGNLRIPIVQGAQLFCTFGELMTKIFGPAFFENGWIKAKFISPVKVFEPFEAEGIVTEIKETEDGSRYYGLDIWVRRSSDQRLAVVGWAGCTVPSEGRVDC